MLLWISNDDSCDEAIVNVAHGDMNALATVYKAYGKMIVSAAKLIVGNQEDAVDVLQEVMVKVLRLAKTYRRGTNPKAWIMTITRNCAIDYVKKRHTDAYIDSMNEEQLHDSGCFYMNDDTLFSVHEALSALSADDKLLVKLKIYYGFSHSEIASVLGVRTATVRKRYERVLQKLKRDLCE